MSSFVPLDLKSSAVMTAKGSPDSDETVPVLLAEKPEIKPHQWPENPVKAKRQAPKRERQTQRRREGSGPGPAETRPEAKDEQEPKDPVARRKWRKQKRDEAKRVAEIERAKRVEARRARAANRDGADPAKPKSDQAKPGGESKAVQGDPSEAPAEDAIPALSESELLALVEEARAQGRLEVEQLVAQERAILHAQSNQLQTTLDAVQQMAQDWTQMVGNECAQVVLSAVDHLVGQTPELLSSMLAQRISMIVERMANERELVLRVAPNQLEEARALVGARDGWQVVADNQIRGGVVAEASGGRLSATLHDALNGLDEVVDAWRQESKAPSGAVTVETMDQAHAPMDETSGDAS